MKYPALEDGTDRGFRNVGKLQSDAGEIPKRIHTRFKTRRKSEIKNSIVMCNYTGVPIFVINWDKSYRQTDIEINVQI